jgi:Septum formation
MAAPAELTGGPIPEPAGPEPPALDAAGEVPDAGDENALAVTDTELDPAPPAPDPGQARGMSRLAVAAVVFGLIVLAGVAVGALAIATHGFRAKNVIQYRLAAVFSLRPGDCINSAPNELSVTVLSCATPHDAEVFATFRLSASSWPGVATVQSQASNGCLSRLAGYLNPQLANAGLAQEYFYPNEQAWRAGVRTVVCEISAPSGQLTGSVRGAS